MNKPHSGAALARPESKQEENFRIALEGALAAKEALKNGQSHPNLYQGAEGQQRKLAELEAKRLSVVAAETASWPRQYVERRKPTEAYDWYNAGRSGNWRGD